MPSLSAERVKLWSYADLMALRTIYWLRQRKQSSGGHEVPASSMPAVRRALRELRELDLDLWNEEGGPAIAVDRAGRVILDPHGLPATDEQQLVAHSDLLDLVHPFPTREGAKGPTSNGHALTCESSRASCRARPMSRDHELRPGHPQRSLAVGWAPARSRGSTHRSRPQRSMRR